MKNIRIHLSLFIVLLLLSGITAFPLQLEIAFLNSHRQVFSPVLQHWLNHLYLVITSTSPIMLYGTDWLAFAHIVISLFFIPAFKKPLQYKDNLKVGIIACILIFPLAFICGPIRGIPFFHQLIDCLFGLFGSLYLYLILRKINQLESTTHATNQ
jgi:hypothetical protein